MVAPITAAIGVAAMAAVIFASTLAQARADLLEYELLGDAKIYISIQLAKFADCPKFTNCALWTTTLLVAILRHSTFACKTRHNKSRLKLALCRTILLVLIKDRTSSSNTAFHEGVPIKLDSFLIAIDSGSTYYLSDRRLDLTECSHE
jgi:hypothetical protein